MNKHLRFAVPLSADAPASIVGFGDAGVLTAVARGDGTCNRDGRWTTPTAGGADGFGRICGHRRVW